MKFTLAYFVPFLFALPAYAMPRPEIQARAKDTSCIPLQETGFFSANSLCIVRATGGKIPEELDCTVVGDTASSCQFDNGLVLDQVCVNVGDGCRKVEDDAGFECEEFKLFADGACF